MKNFKDYLNELQIPSTTEIQNQDIKKDAREIITKTRGLTQGREIDTNSASQNNAFAPNDHEEKNALILKNTFAETVYVNKDENHNVFITIVNKQKMTKRTIALDARGSTLLKRYL